MLGIKNKEKKKERKKIGRGGREEMKRQFMGKLG